MSVVNASNLLTFKNPKTMKGVKHGYYPAILHLNPGAPDICPNATNGCRRACLTTAGRGGMPNTAGEKESTRWNCIQRARRARTDLFRSNPKQFGYMLCSAIESHVTRAEQLRLTPCVRLNGTSDIPWEGMGVFEQYPKLQFYDYTKSPDRMRRFIARTLPANYHLTFSRSEANEQACLSVLAYGGNVAVVFDTARRAQLPKAWAPLNGKVLYQIVDGDRDDLRFLDPDVNAPDGTVIGLRAKGRARKDRSGFVVATGGPHVIV